MVQPQSNLHRHDGASRGKPPRFIGPPVKKIPVAQVPRPCPQDIPLETLEGKPVPLTKEKRNKALVLNFFYPGCLACIEQLTKVEKFIESQHDNSVKILNLTPTIPEVNLGEFLDHHPLTYSVFIGKYNLLEQFQIRELPAHLVINDHWEIVLQLEGPHEDAVERLAQWFARKTL